MIFLMSVTLFFTLFVVGSPVVSQEADPAVVKLFDQINRLETKFSMARSMFQQSLLESTQEQNEAFDELDGRRTLLRDTLSIILRENNTKPEVYLPKMAELTVELEAIETELNEKVLLPHQSEWLRQEQFTSMVLAHGGNLIAAVQSLTDIDLGITEKQQEKIDKLRDEVKMKSREARSEFQDAMNKINTDAKNEMALILTPKQVKIIEDLSGQKLIQKDASPASDEE